MTLKIGLWWGPIFFSKTYEGSFLNFFKLYSCSLVFESIIVLIDLFKDSDQWFIINFSTSFNPPSRKMAPIKASRQSPDIFS